MRIVITGTGLEEFTHVVTKNGVARPEISCELLDIPKLTIALQRAVHEITDWLDNNPQGFIANETFTALRKYNMERAKARGEA